MQKSYKGFGLWFVIYIAGYAPIIFLKSMDAHNLTRLTLIYTACAIAALAYIIYKTDKIYWYNGTSFEEAEAAGYERRMEFAYRHFKKFRNFTVFYTLFSLLAVISDLNIIVDTIVFTAGLIITAVSTIKIKL